MSSRGYRAGIQPDRDCCPTAHEPQEDTRVSARGLLHHLCTSNVQPSSLPTKRISSSDLLSDGRGNSLQLYREVCSQGYDGCCSVITSYVTQRATTSRNGSRNWRSSEHTAQASPRH